MAPITHKNMHYEWRHLGNFQSNSRSSDLLIDKLEYIIKKNLKCMCSERISPDAALQRYNLKILKQLMCKTKHGNLNKTELQTLQRKINGKLKPALKVV